MKENKRPVTPKKLSRQIVRGQQGINLIERVALTLRNKIDVGAGVF